MGFDEMEQAGPFLRRFLNDFDRLWYYYHWCPACKEPHQYIVGPGHWRFNENFEKPSFFDSMRIFTNIPRTPEERINRVNYTLCHYFVRDGFIDYCTDSPHALAGKRVKLPEWKIKPERKQKA